MRSSLWSLNNDVCAAIMDTAKAKTDAERAAAANRYAKALKAWRRAPYSREAEMEGRR